jgi:hypothetical protein
MYVKLPENRNPGVYIKGLLQKQVNLTGTHPKVLYFSPEEFAKLQKNYKRGSSNLNAVAGGNKQFVFYGPKSSVEIVEGTLMESILSECYEG